MSNIVFFSWFLQRLLYLQMDIPNLLNKFLGSKCISYGSSLTSPFDPYKTSKVEGEKYPKKVWKYDIIVEMWTNIL